MSERAIGLLQVLSTLSACCWLLTGAWPRTGEMGPSNVSATLLPAMSPACCILGALLKHCHDPMAAPDRTGTGMKSLNLAVSARPCA